MDLDKIFLSHRDAISSLSACNGELWKEVVGEMQPDHKEAIFWILLFDDSDLYLAHQKFVDVTKKYVEQFLPLELAVFYYKLTDENLVYVDRRVGNLKVEAALRDSEFGAAPIYEKIENFSLFEAKDSSRDGP